MLPIPHCLEVELDFERQSYKKRLKLIQYLKDEINETGIVFFQETYSTVDNESKWTEKLHGNVFYSYDSSISCGVLIGF